MQQFHLFISGDVQGVGFRYLVRKEAKKHRVVGWVRNLFDGRVEAVLQGEGEGLDKVIAKCKKGPMLALVKEVLVLEEEITERFEKLETRPTLKI